MGPQQKLEKSVQFFTILYICHLLANILNLDVSKQVTWKDLIKIDNILLYFLSKCVKFQFTGQPKIHIEAFLVTFPAYAVLLSKWLKQPLNKMLN